MCGRYEQHVPAMRGWAELLRAWPETAPSRFNICPTQPSGTIDAEGYRERSWSLIPRWAKEKKLRYATFNARAESVREKSSFRGAWQASQRCLVPASAYYEWTGPKGKRQCQRIEAGAGTGLCLAGLWETWSGEAEPWHSFTIMTVAAHEGISWLHHRMPVLLEPAQLDCWLHGAPDEAAALLQPNTAVELQVTAVDGPQR